VHAVRLPRDVAVVRAGEVELGDLLGRVRLPPALPLLEPGEQSQASAHKLLEVAVVRHESSAPAGPGAELAASPARPSPDQRRSRHAGLLGNERAVRRGRQELPPREVSRLTVHV
jgi:hypothetical protein